MGGELALIGGAKGGSAVPSGGQPGDDIDGDDIPF
jgi:hypothetical protein